jgi:hypothetical protein
MWAPTEAGQPKTEHRTRLPRLHYAACPAEGAQ